jgi:hypothetical protein
LNEERIFKLRGWAGMPHIAFTSTAPHINLLLIELHVALLKLAHFFNFIKVNHKALLHTVKLANALSTEDGGMLRTIEVFDALIVLLTQVRLDIIMSR